MISFLNPSVLVQGNPHDRDFRSHFQILLPCNARIDGLFLVPLCSVGNVLSNTVLYVVLSPRNTQVLSLALLSPFSVCSKINVALFCICVKFVLGKKKPLPRAVNLFTWLTLLQNLVQRCPIAYVQDQV